MRTTAVHPVTSAVPKPPRSLLRFAAATAFVLASAGCASQPVPFQTVDGPETPSVLSGAGGHLAFYAGRRGCALIQSLAAKADKHCPIVLPSAGTQLAVIPERPGSLLALEHTGYDKDTRQSTLLLTRGAYPADGRGASVLKRNVIATWTSRAGENLYFKAMAVSPDGRQLAMVPQAAAFTRRSLAFFEGALVLIDLDSGALRSTGADIVDAQPILWARDGAQLIDVRAVRSDALPPALVGDAAAASLGSSDRVALIELRNLATGVARPLAVGLNPTWSADEKTLLFERLDAEGRHRFMLNLETGKTSGIELPGATNRGAIAFVGPHRVLYWSYPTQGAAPTLTANNSPLVGPKQMLALKVVDLDTQQFATVSEPVDPRTYVSYTARF